MPHATDAFSRLGSFFRSDGGFDQHDVDVMGSHSWGRGEALAELAPSRPWRPLARRLSDRLAHSVDRDGISFYANHSGRGE
jgi:hypothetical protein